MAQNLTEAYKRSQWRVKDAKEESDEAATRLEELALDIEQAQRSVASLCALPSLHPTTPNNISYPVTCTILRQYASGSGKCIPKGAPPREATHASHECYYSNHTHPECISKSRDSEPVSKHFMSALRIHQLAQPPHWLAHACHFAQMHLSEAQVAYDKYKIQAEIAANTTETCRLEQSALIGPMLAWGSRLWRHAEVMEAKMNQTTPIAKMVEGKREKQKRGPSMCVRDDSAGICQSADDAHTKRCKCDKRMRKEAQDRAGANTCHLCVEFERALPYPLQNL